MLEDKIMYLCLLSHLAMCLHLCLYYYYYYYYYYYLCRHFAMKMYGT